MCSFASQQGVMICVRDALPSADTDSHSPHPPIALPSRSPRRHATAAVASRNRPVTNKQPDPLTRSDKLTGPQRRLHLHSHKQSSCSTPTARLKLQHLRMIGCRSLTTSLDALSACGEVKKFDLIHCKV
jgi:hypothetical protein